VAYDDAIRTELFQQNVQDGNAAVTSGEPEIPVVDLNGARKNEPSDGLTGEFATGSGNITGSRSRAVS